MDPKLSQLDPKLREAYERVMNGPSAPLTQPGNAQPAPQTPPVQTPPSSAEEPVNTQTPSAQQPAPVISGFETAEIPPTPAAPSAPQIDPTPAVNSTIAYNAHDEGKSQGTTKVKKTGGMGKAVLIAASVALLLVAYTFVWVFLFHLKLPFLP